MKRISPDLPEGIDGNLWNKMTADLRGLVWQHVDDDGSFATLAVKADLHSSTIANFAYGQTKSPLLSTVVKLMVAVDRIDQLIAAFEGADKPISLREAQRRHKAK